MTADIAFDLLPVAFVVTYFLAIGTDRQHATQRLDLLQGLLKFFFLVQQIIMGCFQRVIHQLQLLMSFPLQPVPAVVSGVRTIRTDRRSKLRYGFG